MFAFKFWNEEEEGETKNIEKEIFDSESSKRRHENTSQILSRRSDKDVLKLVHSLQSVIQSKFDYSTDLTQRVKYFWATNDALDTVLLSIATEIPSFHNPLWAYDANENFNGLNLQSKHQNDFEDNRIKTSSNVALKQMIKKRPMVSRKPKCVEWLGFTNDQTNFAAIRLLIPGTQEACFTWTNRLIVFLFAHIPSYSTPEDFIRILNPPMKGPLKMHCKNSKCVRLSHIHYLPDDLQMYEGIGCNTSVFSPKKEIKVRRNKKHSTRIKKKTQTMTHLEETYTSNLSINNHEDNTSPNASPDTPNESSTSEKDTFHAGEPSKKPHPKQDTKNVIQDVWSPGF